MSTDLHDHTDHRPGTDRVRAALRGAAATLDLPAPGPEAARTTAHHRARRQQRLTAGIATVAVVAGGVGVTSIITREPGVELDAGAVGSSPSGITFTWTQGEHVLANQPQIVQAPDGVLYALSTAPGVTYEDAGPLPQAVYRSTDGLTWEPTELDPDLQLSTFEVRPDGVLYGLSTAPGTGALRLATSADGGGTWALDDLPALEGPPAVAEGVELASGGVVIDVASRGGTSVATVQQQWYVQPEGLGILGDGQSGWVVPTADGLEVHREGPAAPDPVASVPTDDPTAAATPTPVDADVVVPGEAAATPYLDPSAPPAGPVDLPAPRPTPEIEVVAVPWAEIGLAGPQDLVKSEAFTSTGAGWAAVDLPAPDATAAVEATAEGFIAVLHEASYDLDVATPAQVARSADGLTWSLDAESVIDAVYIRDVGTSGDRIVVTATTGRIAGWTDLDETVTVASSADAGRTWTATDLNDLFDSEPDQQAWFGTSDTGPLGLTTVFTLLDEEGRTSWSTLVYSPDGVTWDVIPGEQIGAEDHGIAWASIDADRIVASVIQPDGSQRTVVGSPTR